MKWAMPKALTEQRGFSIIELMIAILLGGILLGGVLQILASNKQTFRVQTGLARLQENGRYAKFILSNDIRMAGFQGCPKLVNVTPTNLIANPPGNANISNNIAITGLTGTGGTLSPAAPSWLSSNLASGTSIAPDTDVIIIRKASAIGANLATNMANPTSDITITNRITVSPGDLFLIGDCETVDLFKASSGTSGTTITHKTGDDTSDSLSKAYQTDARVYRLQTFAYYIKDTGRDNQLGQPIYALYRQDINGNEEELFDGVENMKVTYGVDTNSDGTADTYQDAAQVQAANNWGSVISTDIALLMSTVENVNPKSQTYSYQGSSVTPSDRMLRRQWDSFIALRNRHSG